jgi:hypothetical protein
MIQTESNHLNMFVDAMEKTDHALKPERVLK